MELRPIRIVQYGLGATGIGIANLVHNTPGMQLVGGIDHNPERAGKDLGTVLGLSEPLGIRVQADPLAALVAAHPDMVVIATRPSLNDTYSQIATCLRARVNVVSTCEELVYPYIQHPELSRELDHLARQSGVSVLGVGINPGFVQDLLPLILTGPCTSVSRITVTRVFDATIRRAMIHHRIGAGLSTDMFHRHITENGVPHIGLRESLHLIAHSIGWHLERVEERADPIVASDWVYDERFAIAPGHVLGTRQTITGFFKGHDVINLTWQVAVDTPETYDEIIIEGVPPLRVRIDGGLHGDQAAHALVLHAIAPVFTAAPGLHTVAELPAIYYRLPIHTAAEYWEQPGHPVEHHQPRIPDEVLH